MFRNKLAYKFLAVFFLFSVTVVAPISLIMYYHSDWMISGIEKIEPLLPEQKAVHDKFKKEVVDSFISLAFYTFILSFIVSLFLSRRFLLPVRELYKGAMALKEGALDIKLEVKAEDELGAVTKAFNDMAETLKQKTQELMRKNTYVNTMVDPLWVVDRENIITDINPAFTRLFGYEKDEVIGASIFDFLDEENERVMREQLRRRDGGVSSSYAISIISKNEGLIPVLIGGAPIVEDGEVVARMGIIKDFRDEVALRDALKEEKEHTETIMDSMVDILLVIDRDLRIVKANAAASVKSGGDITGKPCHSVFHKRPQACFAFGLDCPVKAVFETGRSFKAVHEHFEGDSRVFHEITAYPVKGADGNIMHVVELMRDITDRKKFEEEIAQRNKELLTLNGISRVLSHSLRAEDIFTEVLGRVTSMLGMDGGGIYFLDEQGRTLECKFQKGVSEDFMRSMLRLRVGEDIPGRVAVTGQGMTLADISRDPRVERSVLKHSGIRGLACIPVKGKEKLLGVFYIFSLAPHIFTPEEERILSSIGEMVGMALENIRLYERMRELYEQQRKRRAGEQRNLLRVSSLLSSTLDLRSVLESTVSALRETARADFVWLLEPDGEGNLRLACATQPVAEKGEVIYTEQTSSIEKYALDKGKPVVLSELSTETKFYIPPYLDGYNTACIVPLSVGERALGAMTLFYRGFIGPGEEDIYFLQTTGSILAVAMERARLYEEAFMEKLMADTVLQSIPDGILTVDTGGKVIAANLAVREMAALPPYAVGMQICAAFGRGEENSDLRFVLGECLEDALDGKTSTREAKLHAGKKGVIPIKINSSPVYKDGDVAGVVYVLRDITREKEIDRMKTDFVRAVSHEFRTPLSAIVGMAEMLLEETLDAERQRQYLSTVLDEGRRLSGMVSDLLDVARIESGKEVFRETPIDFASLLRDTEEAFRDAIKKKDMKFSKGLWGELSGYTGDADKLKQLLRNLLDNSLTYSDAGASVEIAVRRMGEDILLTVTDTGWGIPEEDIPHIGEKFYRGRHAGAAKGTGLGLSLCREIARMHGGRLTVESTAGKGTAVTVELPMRRKP